MKQLFLFLSFSFLFNIHVSSQTLYALLIVQNDPTVGTTLDQQSMDELLNKIDINIPQLEVVTKILDGQKTDSIKIEEALTSLRLTSEDVVWVYYTGHGRNYDTWPMTAQQEIPLTWIHERLQQTKARLTIAMFDCCNFLEPLVTAPKKPEYIQSSNSYLDFLFLYSKGHIKTASCASTQLAWGSQNTGSLFTNAFQDAIMEHSSWQAVLRDSKMTTIQMAKVHNITQSPIYQLSQGFQDGTY